MLCWPVFWCFAYGHPPCINLFHFPELSLSWCMCSKVCFLSNIHHHFILCLPSVLVAWGSFVFLSLTSSSLYFSYHSSFCVLCFICKLFYQTHPSTLQWHYFSASLVLGRQWMHKPQTVNTFWCGQTWIILKDRSHVKSNPLYRWFYKWMRWFCQNHGGNN